MSGGWLKLHRDRIRREWERDRKDARAAALRTAEQRLIEAVHEAEVQRAKDPDSFETMWADLMARATQRSLDVSTIMLD